MIDHWLSTFLVEASREHGGNLDNYQLRSALGNIQVQHSAAYGDGAPDVYELPSTQKQWRSLVLPPLPPLIHCPPNPKQCLSSENELPMKVACSTKRKPAKNHARRFGAPLQEHQINELVEGHVPKKTKAATHWALRAMEMK